MFGVVPKNIWAKTNPPDEKNRIELALRSMLVIDGKRIILADSGAGDKYTQKQRDIYAITGGIVQMKERLGGIGLKPDDVTDVVISHLHFDHAGGNTAIENERAVPVFRNAVYHVQESHYLWAKNPSPRDRASFFEENFEPLSASGQLELHGGNYELAGGISVECSDGHTRGQQIVVVENGGDMLVYCADLIPTSSHIPVPFCMGYDNEPLITMKEKDSLLRRVVEKNALLFFEHDPLLETCRVTMSGGGFAKSAG